MRIYLELVVKGEKWVSYPMGMKFPCSFAKIYPFRGRGIVARGLYMLNRLHLDRFVLRKSKSAVVPGYEDRNIAYFWPSAKRTKGRFYGYEVANGAILRYCKFATSSEDRQALEHEIENVAVAQKIANGLYKVPQVLATRDGAGILCAEFEALPEDASTLPIDDYWYGKVNASRKQIANSGYMHGDFAWHNFKKVGTDLWILDWEEMRAANNSLSDEIALDFGLDYYWRGVPVEVILNRFKSRYDDGTAKWHLAMEAVRDLFIRKITMGDVLHEVFDPKDKAKDVTK